MRLKTARILLHTVMTQASANPDYMQQLRSNPVHVLLEADTGIGIKATK